MLPPSAREVAEDHALRIEDITTQAVGIVAGITNQARRPDRWRDAVARIGTELLALQVAAVALSDGYVSDAIDAAGGDPSAEAEIEPNAWEDFTDGGGSLLLNLVYSVNDIPRRGLSSTALATRVEYLSTSIVLSGIHDAARSSSQTASLTRPWVRSYVRMLRGKSCARCAILAGRRYRSVTAFRRHHHCDCVNFPAPDDADDWATDPDEYFESLDAADQDRIFTQAGARAIRDGADMSQVVNARKGITTVSAYGRELQVTTEGTTKRGLYGGYEVLPDGTLRRRPDSELERLPGNRLRTARTPRLLPDEVYLLAEEFGWDRAETLRQLRRFAYVT